MPLLVGSFSPPSSLSLRRRHTSMMVREYSTCITQVPKLNAVGSLRARLRYVYFCDLSNHWATGPVRPLSAILHSHRHLICSFVPNVTPHALSKFPLSHTSFVWFVCKNQNASNITRPHTAHKQPPKKIHAAPSPQPRNSYPTGEKLKMERQVSFNRSALVVTIPMQLWLHTQLANKFWFWALVLSLTLA